MYGLVPDQIDTYAAAASHFVPLNMYGKQYASLKRVELDTAKSKR